MKETRDVLYENMGIILFFIFNSVTEQPLVGEGFHYRGFMITLRHTTIDGTPLDE